MGQPLSSEPSSFARLRKPSLFFLAFYLAWTLRVVLLLPYEDRFESEVAHRVFLDAIRLLLWLAPLWVYLIRVDRAAPLTSLRLDVLPAPRRAVEAFVIAGTYFAVVATIAITLEDKQTIFQRHVPLARWPWVLMGMWLAPIVEEIFFRGFVFRKLRDVLRFRPANLFSALLFASIHVPGWLYLQGFGAGFILSLVSVFIIGYVLGLLVERTNSLWPAIVMHFLNNLLWSGGP
ncbi:MAG: type II CAAX endopeptidase family protein [Candidatus Hydrogenedentales bacterium]